MTSIDISSEALLHKHLKKNPLETSVASPLSARKPRTSNSATEFAKTPSKEIKAY